MFVLTSLLLILQPLPPPGISVFSFTGWLRSAELWSFHFIWVLKSRQVTIQLDRVSGRLKHVSWIPPCFGTLAKAFVSTPDMPHPWGNEATALRVMALRGWEEQYFPRAGAKWQGMSGTFSRQSRWETLTSSFNKNNIPSSRVIQNVKYRQNFKGEKKRLVWWGEKGRLPVMTATIGEVFLVFPLVKLVCNDLAHQARDSSKTSVCTESYKESQRFLTFINPHLTFFFLQTWC